MRKSKGHMFFTDAVEFYELGGEVYKAPLHNCIAIDTEARHGRWHCSRVRWDQYESEMRWKLEHSIKRAK